MAKLNKTVIAALLLIQQTGRAASEVGKPLVEQGLIEVNTDDIDANGHAAARLTQKAIDSMPKEKVVGEASAPSNFTIIDNAVPPPSKRGAGRTAGPSKYPFEQLEPNKSFFLAVSAETPDPMKTLGSAIANATNKYRVDTGKVESVERTKRGSDHKAVVVDGKKVKETVEVPVYDYPRKFVGRKVKAGQKCGTDANAWVAPSDGVLVTRVV